MVRAYKGVLPSLHPTALVQDSAHVIGDVTLSEDASVWFCAVVRGDVNTVRIGRGTNIQDGTVIHVNRRGHPTILEEFVTVGHAARLHGCHVASHCLVGIGAIVLDGVELGEECLVDDADRELIRSSAENYIALKNTYLGTA